MIRAIFRPSADPDAAVGVSLEVGLSGLSRAGIDLRWGLVYIAAYVAATLWRWGDGLFWKLLPISAVAYGMTFLLRVPLSSHIEWRSAPAGYVGPADADEEARSAVADVRRLVAWGTARMGFVDIFAGVFVAADLARVLPSMPHGHAWEVAADTLFVWSVLLPFARLIATVGLGFVLRHHLGRLAEALLGIAVAQGIPAAEACLRAVSEDGHGVA
jgi:hypothetical protein